MKRIQSTAILLVITAIFVVLSGTSHAAEQSVVLQYLLRNSQPSQQQRDMVQEIGFSHKSDAVTTTVVDAVFDGRELSVGLLFHAQRGVFAIINQITVNGVPAYRTNDTFGNMWLGGPCMTSEGDYMKGATATIRQDASGTSDSAALKAIHQSINESGSAEIGISLTLLVPNQKTTSVDIGNPDTAAMWQEIDAIVANGDTPVCSYEPFEVLISSAALGDDFDESKPVQCFLDNAESLMQYANMTVADTFTITFPLAAISNPDTPE